MRDVDVVFFPEDSVLLEQMSLPEALEKCSTKILRDVYIKD